MAHNAAQQSQSKDKPVQQKVLPWKAWNCKRILANLYIKWHVMHAKNIGKSAKRMRKSLTVMTTTQSKDKYQKLFAVNKTHQSPLDYWTKRRRKELFRPLRAPTEAWANNLVYSRQITAAGTLSSQLSKFIQQECTQNTLSEQNGKLGESRILPLLADGIATCGRWRWCWSAQTLNHGSVYTILPLKHRKVLLKSSPSQNNMPELPVKVRLVSSLACLTSLHPNFLCQTIIRLLSTLHMTVLADGRPCKFWCID